MGAGMKPLRFDLHGALTAWQWSPFSIVVGIALVAVAYWYLSADWRLAVRGRRWPTRRTAAFMAGLIAIDMALQSPVATFTGSYFQAHVAQHLLLMVVAPAPPRPGCAVDFAAPDGQPGNQEPRWLGVLHSRPFAVFTHPVPVWFFYFGAMFAFFLSPLVNYADGTHGADGRHQPRLPTGSLLLLVASGRPGPDSALADGVRSENG